MLRKIWSSPVEASGLAYMPGNGRVLIRVDGAPQSLQEKCDAVRGLAGAYALSEQDDGDTLFAKLGNGSAFVQTAHDVWRVMLPPAAAADFAEAVSSSLWWGDWAGGVLWIGLKKDDVAAAQNLRSLAAASGGYAVLVRGDAQMRARVGAFAPEPPPRAALTRSVKAAFDPLGLFNPGRMYEAV
jgi:glycolate oxidase FAD binding subunit